MVSERKYADYYKTQEKYLLPNDPADYVKEQELSKLINKTVNKLPERCKKIFCLSRFEGLKYREIAEELSISIKTVEANMGIALKHFRKSLSDYI